MKKYLAFSLLSFACVFAQAQTLKELKAEEKILKAEVKRYKEAEQIEKTKLNIIKLREFILAKEKTK